MVSYWHSSQTALPVGTHLTPLRERKGSGFTPSQYQHLSSNDHDPDLVYSRQTEKLARAWCLRSKGALLLVDPVGTVEPDPDFPATSF